MHDQERSSLDPFEGCMAMQRHAGNEWVCSDRLPFSHEDVQRLERRVGYRCFVRWVLLHVGIPGLRQSVVSVRVPRPAQGLGLEVGNGHFTGQEKRDWREKSPIKSSGERERCMLDGPATSYLSPFRLLL